MDEQPFEQLREAASGLDATQLGLVVDFARIVSEPADATDAEVADVAVSVLRVGAAVEGAGAHWLRRFEASGVWALSGARSAAGWLDHEAETSRLRAGARLKRARTLAGLAVVDWAFASGRLGDEKVRLLLDVHKQIPEQVVEHQEYLVDTVATLTVEGANLFLATWYEQARPPVPDSDADDGPDPEPAGGRSHLSLFGTTGGTHVNGFLETEDAAVVAGAVDAEIDAWFRAGLLEGDPRSRDELRAAAMAAISARYGLPGDQHGQSRPLALVLADADTLAGRTPTDESPNMAPICEIVGHGPISPDTARRLLCGADTSRVILRGGSEILDVGMRERFATAAQWRGLIAAAAGQCEFPGCDAPHHWCQAHHLDPYNPRTGTGPTNIANLAMVCHRHHHLVHEGRFTLTRGPTGITARRPDGTIVTVAKKHRPPPRTDHPPDPGTDPGEDPGKRNSPDPGTDHPPDPGGGTSPDPGTDHPPDPGTDADEGPGNPETA